MKQFYLAFIFSLLISNLAAHDPLAWHFSYAPYYRHLNSVQVLNENTFIVVGGNEANDVIMSIFRTTDGGQNWGVFHDFIDSAWLKSVYFVDSITGFAAGYNGGLLKSTDMGRSWSPQTVPLNVSTRNFNSIFFINPQTGFVAGGNQSNDSLFTILKTTNGGASWVVMKEDFGYWLKAIYFTNTDSGYAVGDHGVALKTIDGGSTWNQMTLPGNASSRDFNTVFFIDATTGFIGGGNKTNDSIQTILKTTDGGNSWSIISDNLGPWITSIHFPKQFPAVTTGFASGDRGTVLITEDAGDTWNIIAIPDTINDTVGLRSVFFLNLDFGVAAGSFGKILTYRANTRTLPVAQTEYATDLTPGSVTLNGVVNANGSSCLVAFDYGTTPDLGSTVIVDTISGNSAIFFSEQISGLNTDVIYYFRIRASNSSGTSYGEIKQFFTGVNPIPNWDFEQWDTIADYMPTDWVYLGGVTQTTSYDGSFAIALQGTDSLPYGAVFLGFPGGIILKGGVPLAARPDSLIGHFNYNIAAGDSALILLFFKKNGNVNSQQFYYITGSSNGNFERLSFPITFTNSDTPDSVVIAIGSSNPINNVTNPLSYIALDNISFSGTTENVPNPDFEDWQTTTILRLINWATSDDEPGAYLAPTISKTTDMQHGNFAVMLQNSEGSREKVASISTDQNDLPSFAVKVRHHSLNGFLKYFPENSDTLEIRIDMFKNGQKIGIGRLNIDSVVSSYTFFSTPIIYNDSITIPDSASIRIYAGVQRLPFHGRSILYIDNLSFDGVYTNINEGISIHQDELSWKVYPNPTDNKIIVSGTCNKSETVVLSVIDLSGKIIFENKIQPPAGKFEFPLDLKNVNNGIYIITMQRQGSIQFKKLVVE